VGVKNFGFRVLGNMDGPLEKSLLIEEPLMVKNLKHNIIQC
jgi:hypothetical protein